MYADIILEVPEKPITVNDWTVIDGGSCCQFCEHVSVTRIFTIHVETLPVKLYAQLLRTKYHDFIDNREAINYAGKRKKYTDLVTNKKFDASHTFTICGSCCWLFMSEHYSHGYHEFVKLYDSKEGSR